MYSRLYNRDHKTYKGFLFDYHARDRFWTRHSGPGDWCHVISSTDVSPIWNTYDDYDPECSACWLGMSHSAEYHKKHLEDQ